MLPSALPDTAGWCQARKAKGHAEEGCRPRPSGPQCALTAEPRSLPGRTGDSLCAVGDSISCQRKMDTPTCPMALLPVELPLPQGPQTSSQLLSPPCSGFHSPLHQPPTSRPVSGPRPSSDLAHPPQEQRLGTALRQPLPPALHVGPLTSPAQATAPLGQCPDYGSPSTSSFPCPVCPTSRHTGNSEKNASPPAPFLPSRSPEEHIPCCPHATASCSLVLPLFVPSSPGFRNKAVTGHCSEQPYTPGLSRGTFPPLLQPAGQPGTTG